MDLHIHIPPNNFSLKNDKRLKPDVAKSTKSTNNVVFIIIWWYAHDREIKIEKTNTHTHTSTKQWCTRYNHIDCEWNHILKYSKVSENAVSYAFYCIILSRVWNLTKKQQQRPNNALEKILLLISQWMVMWKYVDGTRYECYFRIKRRNFFLRFNVISSKNRCRFFFSCSSHKIEEKKNHMKYYINAHIQVEFQSFALTCRPVWCGKAGKVQVWAEYDSQILWYSLLVWRMLLFSTCMLSYSFGAAVFFILSVLSSPLLFCLSFGSFVIHNFSAWNAME